VRIAVAKRRLYLTIAISAFLAVPLAAQAQGYPSRPIRSIMTVAGGADVVARLVAQGLTGALGQPVVVETQCGAGGAIGAETVARAAPDGYTIMLTSASALVMNRFLSKNARLDPLKDFTPITKAFETVALIVTSPALPVGSVRELIEYAKRHPGRLSYGTSGIGTTHHLSGESIRLLTGIDWVHVPYKGGPPVITDLVAGEIQVGFSILATAAPFLASGKIRVLAVNGAKRYHVIPDVPTVAEQLPGYEAPSTWGGYFGPAAMPRAIVARLHDEIVRILNSPEVRAKAEDIGFPVATSTPEELSSTIRRDIEYTAGIVKAVGIRPE
jgi:tripartite-type tricarboxylate transporter receptor subunit TctC